MRFLLVVPLFLAASAAAQPTDAEVLLSLAAQPTGTSVVHAPEVITYDGYAEQHALTLEQGEDYVFLVATLPGEGHVPDVSVEDPDFDAFLLADGPGESETVEFTADAPGQYVFTVEVEGCAPGECQYSFSLYRK